MTESKADKEDREEERDDDGYAADSWDFFFFEIYLAMMIKTFVDGGKFHQEEGE